jgi:protein-disulfide isomerase
VGAGTYKEEVEADYQVGIAAGIRGTPASFVLDKNGKVVGSISGAQPFSEFKKAIEQALAAS